MEKYSRRFFHSFLRELLSKFYKYLYALYKTWRACRLVLEWKVKNCSNCKTLFQNQSIYKAQKPSIPFNGVHKFPGDSAILKHYIYLSHHRNIFPLAFPLLSARAISHIFPRPPFRHIYLAHPFSCAFSLSSALFSGFLPLSAPPLLAATAAAIGPDRAQRNETRARRHLFGPLVTADRTLEKKLRVYVRPEGRCASEGCENRANVSLCARVRGDREYRRT